MNRLNEHYILVIFICLCCLSSKSQDLTIGVHSSGSVGDMNLYTLVAAGVTTFSPTGAPCQLTDVTLNAALATGNVNINTPSGSIIFTPGTFRPGTGGRTLSLTASANVTLTMSLDTAGGGGFQANTNMTNVSIIAGASALIGVTETLLVGGNLTVTAADIRIQNGGLETGGGVGDFTATNKFETVGKALHTNGGNVKIVAKDIDIMNGGIDTGGGDVELIVTNVIDLTGHSIRTFNGMFVASAVNFNGNGSNLREMGTGKISITLSGALVCSGDGFITNGGDITVNAVSADFNSNGIDATNSKIVIDLTGGLTSSGRSLVTTNNDIEVKAASADITSNGISAVGGDVKLEIIGDIAISGGGTISNNYFSSGNKLTLQGSGIETNGNVVIEHLEDVSVSGGGIATNGGSLTSKGKQFIMNSCQITSSNGNIVFCHTGNFDINGGGITSGTGTVDIGTVGNVIVGGNGIWTYGSSVKVQAKDGNISTSGGAINTGFGSSTGGVLTETGSVTQIHPVQLGGGNIILDTVSSVACLIVASPIPTLGQWSLIVLSLLMMIVGTSVLNQDKKIQNNVSVQS